MEWKKCLRIVSKYKYKQQLQSIKELHQLFKIRLLFIQWFYRCYKFFILNENTFSRKKKLNSETILIKKNWAFFLKQRVKVRRTASLNEGNMQLGTYFPNIECYKLRVVCEKSIPPKEKKIAAFPCAFPQHCILHN